MRVQAKQQRNQEAEAPINRIGWPLFTRAVGRSESRYGNIDPFIHSTTPVGLALGPDSPRDDERGPEPLVIQRAGFAPASRYSCLHSHSHTVHGRVPPPLRPGVGRSPTTRPYGRIRVFGGVLEPRYIVGAEPLDQ